MNKNSLYILRFEPILKEKVWGGAKLAELLDKKPVGSCIGESWEISAVEGDCSIVNNGMLSGQALDDLLINYKEALIGKKNYERFGVKFPLLIKFIDAKENLSIQLHPGDEIAKEKHDSLGKTEMWYVVQADEEANIIIGFNQKITLNQYKKHVEKKTIKDTLHYEPASPGATFFVYSGLIHAIGEGVLLAEIQQTSDITYRIYDWDREGKEGEYRELHQQEAMEAIDFDNASDPKVTYDLQKNEVTALVSCPYFITNVIAIDGEILISHVALDSFVIYMCVEGVVLVQSEQNTLEIKMGETILVPAVIKSIKVIAKNAKLLQTYI